MIQLNGLSVIFERWKHKGKPAGSNATPNTGVSTVVSTTVTMTAVEKQQKTINSKLGVVERHVQKITHY